MTTRLASPITIRWRGPEPYETSFAAMREFTEQRSNATPDEIWLVEHPPVYTLGQAGDPAHLLSGATHGARQDASRAQNPAAQQASEEGSKPALKPVQKADASDPAEIPLVRTDRGGQITFHGPGQVVAYLLLDLRRRKLMVRELVVQIEQAAIETLAAYNVVGERKPGAPGIYVASGLSAGSKIAALGLKVRRGCTYHGVSLNVRMDLSPFDNINPCGYAGLKTIDLSSLGVLASWTEVATTLAERLMFALNETDAASGAALAPHDFSAAGSTPA